MSGEGDYLMEADIQEAVDANIELRNQSHDDMPDCIVEEQMERTRNIKAELVVKSDVVVVCKFFRRCDIGDLCLKDTDRIVECSDCKNKEV